MLTWLTLTLFPDRPLPAYSSTLLPPQVRFSAFDIVTKQQLNVTFQFAEAIITPPSHQHRRIQRRMQEVSVQVEPLSVDDFQRYILPKPPRSVMLPDADICALERVFRDMLKGYVARACPEETPEDQLAAEFVSAGFIMLLTPLMVSLSLDGHRQ